MTNKTCDRKAGKVEYFREKSPVFKVLSTILSIVDIRLWIASHDQEFLWITS